MPGFTALGGGSFQESMINGLRGSACGAVTGTAVGGIFGGAQSFFKGNNVWSGEAIAPGRNAFSFNNTPIGGPALEPIPASVGNVDVTQPNGGDGITPMRHFNIELVPRPIPPLSNGGHILLPPK